jgi:hypothetical protein
MGDEQALERAGHCETKTIRSWIRMENEQGEGGNLHPKLSQNSSGFLTAKCPWLSSVPPPS